MMFIMQRQKVRKIPKFYYKEQQQVFKVVLYYVSACTVTVSYRLVLFYMKQIADQV